MARPLRTGSSARLRVLAAALCALGLASCDEPLGDPLCDGCEKPLGRCHQPGAGLLYPLEQGAWWRYQVLDADGREECPDKLVSMAGPQAIPGRPDVIGYLALSEREKDYARRWQEATPSGIRRHVDEWFYLDGSGWKIEHFCPFKTRVDDGDHACENAAWTEHHADLLVEVEPGTDWRTCWGLTVDPATCEAQGATAGCKVTRVDDERRWTVESVDAEVTVPAGTFHALRVRAVTPPLPDGSIEDVTFYWVRGVGKVQESSAAANEKLVTYCLPSGGCTAAPPSKAELQQECLPAKPRP